MESGGYLHVAHRIAAPSEGAIQFGIQPPGDRSDQWNGGAGSTFPAGERHLLLATFDSEPAVLTAQFRVNVPIEATVVESGATERIPLDLEYATPHPDPGYPRWERATYRQTVPVEEPFYAQVLMGQGGVVERFTAQSDRGERWVFQPAENPAYWEDEHSRTGRTAGFSGGPGNWTFEAILAQPRGNIPIAIGFLWSPAFIEGTSDDPNLLPRFEPWFLVDNLAYGPGGGFQERPPYMPGNDLIIGRP